MAAALVKTDNLIEARVEELARVLTAPTTRSAVQEDRRGALRAAAELVVELVPVHADGEVALWWFYW